MTKEKDRKFLNSCQFWADEWSKDPSLKVASIIVRPDNSIASLGYNGYPKGVPDINMDNKEYKYDRVVHAESNAIDFSREDLTGYTLYSNVFPCNKCAERIIQKGIRRVVSTNKRFMCETLKHDVSIEMFNHVGIEFEIICD